MRRSITLRLVLAFLAVAIAGAVLAAGFARWAATQAFERLVVDRARSIFIEEVRSYYEEHGSWIGVVAYFRERQRAQSEPPPPPNNRPSLPRREPPVPYAFGLANEGGVIVLPSPDYRLGDRVPAARLAQGVEIEVDGEAVGTVLTSGSVPQMSARERQFLAQTSRALRYAALGATVIALVLGVLLARTLTRPLRELTTAIRAMAQGDLEQRVAVRSQDELGELAAAFNRMSADLAQANAQRRQMTADIAHDLRTPLTVIAGYLESMRDGVLKPTPTRFETMYQEAQHLLRLVEDLRTLSLADSGELALNIEAVPPDALLEQVAAAYAHQAEQQDITLRVEAANSLPALRVDPDRMLQVLGNLVSNALRYTQPGGEIALRARPHNAGVALSVADTGSGVPPDALPHIFERFYRVDPAREGESSGLGLAIAQSIVQAHGGTITAESEVGVGTRFCIQIL